MARNSTKCEIFVYEKAIRLSAFAAKKLREKFVAIDRVKDTLIMEFNDDERGNKIHYYGSTSIIGCLTDIKRLDLRVGRYEMQQIEGSDNEYTVSL